MQPYSQSFTPEVASLHCIQADETVVWTWYVVRTRSNAERTVAQLLAGQGYESYVPVRRVKKRWSDRVVITEQPLFSGYVFCRFEVEKRLPIVATTGVVSIVSFGNMASEIPVSEIDAIRTAVESGLDVEPCDYLACGQKVRVNYGPLKDVEGILVAEKTKFRMLVSITLLQRSVSVEIDRDCLTRM